MPAHRSLILLAVLFTFAVSGLASPARAESIDVADATAPGNPAYNAAWRLSEGIQTPESAYYDAASRTLFVSNVAGSPTEKDGVGWISKLSDDGRVQQAKWVDGLHAPKGMRAHGGKLFVSDIDALVTIDLKTGKVLSRAVVAGAQFLNDVAVSPAGKVYVSDMATQKIHEVSSDGKATTVAEGPTLEHPNGLLFDGGKLLIVGWGQEMAADFTTKVPGRLLSLDLKSRKVTPLSEPFGNLDGLEKEGPGTFLVSDWMAGKVFRVSKNGKQVTELLRGFKGAADLGYLPAKKLLIVPRMNEDQISAYDLGKYPKP